MSELPPSYDAALSYPTVPSVPSAASGQLPQYVHPHHHTAPLKHGARLQSSNITRPKMGEVKLFEGSNERRRHEELADLYAIIKVTDSLEAAYSRDAISTSEYSESCTRLLSQFKGTESALITGGMITSAEIFMREYNIDCPRAYDRLIRAGVPATVMHMSHDDRADSVIVAETVQAFITAMDALKLEQRAVDEVQPLLAELMSALTRVAGLPADFEGLVKMRLWLQKLNQMRAVEELSDEEARQLIFDLEGAYSAFHRYLSTGGRKS
ncbi:vps28 [Symbiodinium microadriaticum]|nr:vps28 [Symbiodinium microadriaticum]